MQKIRANDPGAWDELFKRYHGRLSAYVRRRLKDHAAVEDVVQNTFVGFLNSLPNYDERRDLQTWLFTIASHKVTDQLRKNGRRPHPSGGEADDEMLDRTADGRQRPASSLARSAERREQEEDALGEALRAIVREWKSRGLYKQLYYNYEAALLAAGVPRNQIYPVTDDKIKVVFQKLNEIKPHVKVWWTAGAQPPQLLSSGELALCSAWTGRILAVMKEKAPVAMTYSDGIAWGNAWVVIKGSPHAKLAMEAINYAISEEAQLRLLDAGTYGPALTSAAAKATPEQQKALVTAPDNAKKMLIINEEQAAQYSAKYEAEWNRFQLA